MSDSAANYQFAKGRYDNATAESLESHKIRSSGERPLDHESIRINPPERRFERESSAKSWKIQVIRRIRGFLIEIQSDRARVAFIEDESPVEYDLPAKPFRQAGILIRNQPFQIDEFETKDEEGAMIIGYKYLALAKESDAYTETLNFDEERKRKRELILKKLGKSKA